MIRSLREYTDEAYDAKRFEEETWIPDEVFASFGERGLMGLYVPEEYGGQGLSQTGYCRVSEAFGQVDGTLAVVMGVHQSIGMKGIVLGSDEQKQRFLPDLASGRKLAAFALTEPGAGSDVHGPARAPFDKDGSLAPQRREALHRQRQPRRRARHLRPLRNRRQGQAHRPDPRREKDGGVRGGERYDTMGLRANDLRRSTTRTSASRRRTCSASPARASGSPCTSSTTAG